MYHKNGKFVLTLTVIFAKIAKILPLTFVVKARKL